jgi:hypothetical protein
MRKPTSEHHALATSSIRPQVHKYELATTMISTSATSQPRRRLRAATRWPTTVAQGDAVQCILSDASLIPQRCSLQLAHMIPDWAGMRGRWWGILSACCGRTTSRSGRGCLGGLAYRAPDLCRIVSLLGRRAKGGDCVRRAMLGLRRSRFGIEIAILSVGDVGQLRLEGEIALQLRQVLCF